MFSFFYFREMASQGLFPAEGQLIAQNLDMKYPHLEDILDYITKMQPRVLDSSEMRGHKLLFPPQTYTAMIKFLLKCFEVDVSAISSNKAEFQCNVERLCSLIEHALAIEGSVELHANASHALIAITSHFPEVLDNPLLSFLFSDFFFVSLVDIVAFLIDAGITICIKDILVETITFSSRP